MLFPVLSLMPSRAKITKHTSPKTNSSMQPQEISGWERSKISNQDLKTLKTLGLMKEDNLILPGDESFPRPRIGYRVTLVDHLIRVLSAPIHEFLRGLLFVYGIQLHQLTPNSILHISIFITLCECFLGTHPHWGLWKHIFCIRRNSSRNVAYNVGGIVICIRPDVDYFDVKFPDSVQGWRRRWLYIREEGVGSQENNIAPFDGAAKIIRRQSWDAEASQEEKTATDSLMKRIRELQNTRGKELSGVQITAHHFLRIRVQPLQARKNPLWMYTGEEEDVDRVSEDLSVKDLERLVRRFSSLSKKSEVPASCRVEPYSGNHALPKNHQILSSVPPLPEASSEKEIESDASELVHSLPSAASPRSKRKRGDVEDSGASKPAEPAAELSSPEDGDAFDPYGDAGSVSSGRKEEEEEELAVTGAAPTSTSNTMVLSEEIRMTADSSPPPQRMVDTSTPPPSPRAPSPKRLKVGAGDEKTLILGSSSTPLVNDPLMDQFIRLGTQSIGFRDEADALRGRNDERFELLAPKDDHLLDALSILELQGDLARTNLSDSRAAFSRLFPHFFPKETEKEIFSAIVKRFLPNEDLALAYRRENLKIGVEGTIALVANSGQEVDWSKAGNPGKIKKDKWKALVKDTKAHSKSIIDFFKPKPASSTSTAKTEVK
ncbi:hypothetical protein QYE76_064416 [Lolium multiflorum]|uniref:Transposase (putative) gypsy type domain-containing protein n=1 Tax=Lolium multiflorum TaxID=4521 RepID=A0AAD8S6E6_LOLMU|nr:hypothetical protein QYE76_064416 [Lolium multiflorum]